MVLCNFELKAATVLVLCTLLPYGELCHDSPCDKIDPACDPGSLYRTYDGSCSNLCNALYGKVNHVYGNLMELNYYDGKSEFRRDIEGQPLPEERPLSYHLFPDEVILDKKYTICLYSWGQLLAHDCTRINITTPDNEECCTSTNRMLPKNKWPPRCAPIEVFKDDPFYSKPDVNVRCLNFFRAETSKDPSYQQPARKVNAVSHIMDASFVYGSTKKTALDLRKMKKGKLLNVYIKDREFPPSDKTANNICQNPANKTFCPKTGDNRAVQNPEITCFQILFFRLHNYMARKMVKLNPHWSDERIYQEVRRMIGAILQHITYKYYLPYTLGEQFCKDELLLPKDDCESCDSYYDCRCNPSTLNEFAGSAFRSFHSMVAPEINLLNKNFTSFKTIRLKDYYFAPWPYVEEKRAFPGLVRAICTQPLWAQDRWVTVDLTQHLLQPRNKTWGNDLVAIDINRGRDMGVPTYVEVRRFCGLSVPFDFDDMEDVSHENIKLLKKNYKHVDDLDLYVGGMLETLIPGTLTGPTFRCIIAKQFQLYKCGDRFYYENYGLPTSFSPDQLKEIKKVTLSWISCKVGKVKKIQRDVFVIPDTHGNKRVSCDEIEGFSFNPWIEESCCS